jgi:hypothetical protein
MIIFLIPVRHNDGVKDYNLLWWRLNNTLRSIVLQTDDDWRVVVCANKVLPIFNDIPDDKVIFIEQQRPFIAHTQLKWDAQYFRSHVIDKAMRRQCGVLYSMNMNWKPEWYFMVDADDYLALDLVENLHALPANSLCVGITRGVVLNTKNEYYVTDNFNEMCGTSFGVRPSLLYDTMNQHDNTNTCVLLGHHQPKYFMRLCKNTQVSCLSNKVYAGYLLHEENHGKYLYNFEGEWKPITEQIRKRLSIHLTSPQN